jgi:uncharacterized SAM-binding protein YcdF (DUF218 family)
MRVARERVAKIARDLNTLADYLALRDALDLEPASAGSPVDCLVLLPSAVLRTAERAFAAIRNGVAPVLLVSGGQGHSTALLREAIAQHPRYAGTPSLGRSEAEMVGQIAVAHWAIDPARLVLEATSTNCGENATRTLEELSRRGLPCRKLLLMQDPTMQRRTDASFRQAFRSSPGTVFVNDPTFVPLVVAHRGALAFDDPDPAGLWSLRRYISLVMGEIPRLRDDEHGYGPRGRGFIPHVDIPGAVEAAYARLRDALGTGERG